MYEKGNTGSGILVGVGVVWGIDEGKLKFPSGETIEDDESKKELNNKIKLKINNKTKNRIYLFNR